MVDVTQADIDRIKELLQDLNPPKPVVDPPVTVITPIETFWQKYRLPLTAIASVLAMAILQFGVSQKWLTPEQAQQIQHTFVDEKTGQLTTVTTKTTGEKIAPVAEKPSIIIQKTDGTTVDITKPTPKVADVTVTSTQPTAITIDQVKPWLDVFVPIIQKMIDESKKPPLDKPPTTIPPVTNPPPITTPPPNNPPINPATTLKLGVTDANGLPMASSSVASGKLLFIKLEGFSSGKIVWTKRPTGDVQYGEVPGTQTAAIVLGPGAELDLFVTDYGIQQQVDLRVTANQGAQPPPVDPPIVVTPPINPPISQSKIFTLYVVESSDPKNPRSLTTASILNNLDQRNKLKDRGHVIMTKTDRDNDPSVAYVKSQGTPLPAMAIYDNATKQFVQSVQLPIDLGMSLIIPMGG